MTEAQSDPVAAAPALIFASGMLALAASGVPVNGVTPDVPMIKTENGTASDVLRGPRLRRSNYRTDA